MCTNKSSMLFHCFKLWTKQNCVEYNTHRPYPGCAVAYSCTCHSAVSTIDFTDAYFIGFHFHWFSLSHWFERTDLNWLRGSAPSTGTMAAWKLRGLEIYYDPYIFFTFFNFSKLTFSQELQWGSFTDILQQQVPTFNNWCLHNTHRQRFYL